MRSLQYFRCCSAFICDINSLRVISKASHSWEGFPVLLTFRDQLHCGLLVSQNLRNIFFLSFYTFQTNREVNDFVSLLPASCLQTDFISRIQGFLDFRGPTNIRLSPEIVFT